ncbi:gamma-1-syntrophin [Eurytemora carolleeae]|uniref:gamma-1-syntrophin n=1 Tax=Eurytemora carolleeae TaxID=1294199 RepID=UPI000C768B2C|nr:gamma-1-syntrophin [Eurytemora carolleeae]|eukprot:XP_023333990.1 gamma-1-syntrophin-like [Eurytemora affinis]
MKMVGGDRKDRHSNLRKFHYGLVSVSDGKSRPLPSRLKLCSDYLVLQREEFHIWDDETSYPVESGLREIVLQRSKDGNLGISIKGGLEHNLPILISRVSSTEESARDIYIGDAIVKVNETSLSNMTHQDALTILQDAGNTVRLTLKHYKATTPFLLKQFGRFIPEYDESNPICLEQDLPGASAGGHHSQIPESPCSVSSDSSGTWIGISRVKKNWTDVVKVPLLMAYTTRYIFGTDKLRPSSFEVRGMDGSSTGVVHNTDPSLLTQWLKLIGDYISLLNSYQATKLNRSFPVENQISYMTWVAEGILSKDQAWQNWKPRFLVLKGSEIFVFEKGPLTPEEWSQGPPPIKYKVFEAMFRVIKESEYVDERQHCFLIQTFGQQSHYLSVETRQELLRLESAWHRAVCLAISQLGAKTFHVVYKNKPSALSLDWEEGFVLKGFHSATPEWSFQFSQLKGSSDDGNATLKLHFHRQMSKDAVTEEVICPKLQELLFFMHSFLTAKVASLDPAFLPNRH